MGFHETRLTCAVCGHAQHSGLGLGASSGSTPLFSHSGRPWGSRTSCQAPLTLSYLGGLSSIAKHRKNPRPYLVLHQRSEVCSRGAGTKHRQRGDQHGPAFMPWELFPHTDLPSSSLLPLMLRSPTLTVTSSGRSNLTLVFLTFQRCCPHS